MRLLPASIGAAAALSVASAHADETWWSLRPLERPAGGDIDHFIQAKHAELGLTMAPEADRQTLIRRLYFDLWGLPPSPAEVRRFVADPDPNAYSKLVERLLASPRYGERWARHWLDVVGYGESHGYDKDKPRPNAWPYRDYVIRSFNEDKPYAQFVREQLAGDVLFPGSAEGIVATGFIAAGPWDFIGHAEVPEEKIDGQVARHLDRDNMVTTALNTFCSLTVQCAQCHDHKADPVTMGDYYALQAVFAALDRADREFDLDPAISQRRAELRERRAKLPPARGERFGYHSQVAKAKDIVKWVQVDLGSSQPVDRVVITGADEYGFPDFGFPHRFKVEASAHEDFREATVLLDATALDYPRPGAAPLVIEHAAEARFVRVTATALWSRRRKGEAPTDDWIFALGELEVFANGKRVQATEVTALDSIQAMPRWGRANLVDGIKSRDPESAAEIAEIDRELASLPAPKVVYCGTVHTGKGTFKGRGHLGGRPREIFVLHRGNVTQRRDPVSPGTVPGIVPDQPARFALPADHTEGDRRAALAEWVVHPDNTLTWRSIVNRIWQYHFGRGLVDTPNDFGRIGGQPSHPELLDGLALDFREGGGSIKDLHRQILNSATYKQRSEHDPADAEIDSSNQFLWRQNRRRLEAEAVRDTVLSVAGKLDLEMGGPSFRDFVIEKPQHSPHYQYHKADPDDPKTHRRSIYRFIIRSQPQPLMDTLDCADPSQLVDKRGETTTALQALAMLNNRFVVRMAEHFAQRVGGDPDPVASAFALALSREPAPDELAALSGHAAQHGLEATCRLIINLNEFSYVD